MSLVSIPEPSTPRAGGNADSNTHLKDTAPIATVQKDELIVTRGELWSYYLSTPSRVNLHVLPIPQSIGPTTYTLTLLQGLTTAAGYDPVAGPGSSCLSNTASGECVVPWMGGTKPVASIILIANGISFAIMAVIFTTIGSVADYSSCGRWILLAVTVICWAAQYACLTLTSSDRWQLAVGLFIVGLVSYAALFIFLTAAFPCLARNTPHSRSQREKYEKGQISVEEHEREESLEKNRISIISVMHNVIGFTVATLLNMAFLLPSSTAHDPKVDNYILALDTSYWVLLGIWWFIFQAPRAGPPLPKGESYFTIGWKQIWTALKTYKLLPNTLVYFFSWRMRDVITTMIPVAICQNDQFRFSFLQNTYLGLSQIIPSIFSTLGFWHSQRYRRISTKRMLSVTLVVMVLIPLWGMIGIWTRKFRFRNAWEFWAYNVVAGLFQAPYLAYSQTMMAELSPPEFDNVFFGLYGLSNFASALIGPYVVQAIIDRTHDNWQGFPFLFAITTAGALIIWFGVDVEKGRRDAVRWGGTACLSC